MTPKPPLSISSLVVTLLTNLGAIAAVKNPNGDVPSAVMGIVVAVAGLVNLLYVHQRHLTIRAAIPSAPTIQEIANMLGSVRDTAARLERAIAGVTPLVSPGQTPGVAPYHAAPTTYAPSEAPSRAP